MLKNTVNLLVENDRFSWINGVDALSLRRVGHVTWKILQNGDYLLRQYNQNEIWLLSKDRQFTSWKRNHITVKGESGQQDHLQ
jgi:hypothetical protein